MMKRKYFLYGLLIVGLSFFLLWCFCLPKNLFEGVPFSTVVYDRTGQLLGVRISDDSQLRFLPSDTLPEKFVKALVEFEDRTFYSHIGVSARAIARAVVQNCRNKRVVSGASTISMQVIRLSRHRRRSLWEKVVEAFMATRLEFRYSKNEILKLYASYAPFGGNVVGLNAALWRYIGNNGAELSWAEAATLAVLQNAPSSIHLDKNRNALKEKRNRLLKRLYEKGEMSKDDYHLSLEEPLIGRPLPMPNYAYHLVDWEDIHSHGKQINTGIDLSLQKRVEETIDKWNEELSLSGAADLAAVIMDVSTGKIVAYCGNANLHDYREGLLVDLPRANRSSGSILKPLLYASALQEGVILPHSLLTDVPTNFSGFCPANFDKNCMGAVPADEALALSLNIPNVYLLKEFGVMRFVDVLKKAGFTSLNKPSDAYGLSVVLGGAEVKLIDAVSCYARMAGCYQNTNKYPDFPIRDRVALYHTFEAMRKVKRPDNLDWERISSVQNIAWKTGTSYGSRDAWAVGVTPKYAIGVWVGNADGHGVPDLTGVRGAGPVFFDLLHLLPSTPWFKAPDSKEGVIRRVCRLSGNVAGPDCNETEEMLLPKSAMNAPLCKYCKLAYLSLDGKYRIEDRSEQTKLEHFFVVPPSIEQYYVQQHPEYRVLPPLKKHTGSIPDESICITYPREGSVLSLGKQLNGTIGGVVCKVVHTNTDIEIFWHLDDAYLGSTTHVHQMKIYPEKGQHRLSVVDAEGNKASVSFIIQ